ncbi:MAG: TolC family protein [Candidatus Aenigmatarchaeota archaeon]
MRFRKIFIFLVLFLISSTIRAQEFNLTLDEIVLLALRDNPEILLKNKELEKAKQKIIEAKRELLPDLTLNFNLNKTRGLYQKDITQNSTNLNLRQIIFSGGRIINTIRLTQKGFEITEAILDKTKQEVVFNTIKVFYGLILAKDLVRLNKRVLENTKEHFKVLKKRYKNGEVSELEIKKIEEALERAKQVYKASLNQLDSYENFLKNLLHLDLEIKIKPKGEINYEPKELIFDKAYILALSRRPEIRQYEAQIEQLKASKEVIKAQNRPNIYAVWDYYMRSHSSGIGGISKNQNDYNVIGLAVSWPIFDGFQSKARLEEILTEIKEAQIAKDKVIRDIALELKNAYLELKNALNRIETVEKDFLFYRENLRSIKEKYSQGIVSHLELLDAQLQYKIANFNKKQAIYEYNIAKLNFEKAQGGL